MATEPKGNELTRRPGATRSLVRGVAVKAREVHVTRETVAVGSAAAGIGGWATMIVSLPFEGNAVPFAQQGPFEIGVEIMGGVAAGWVAYGAYRGSKALAQGLVSARRNLVETGRAEIERTASSRSLGE